MLKEQFEKPDVFEDGTQMYWAGNQYIMILIASKDILIDENFKIGCDIFGRGGGILYLTGKIIDILPF